jgi:hypothetical protein
MSCRSARRWNGACTPRRHSTCDNTPACGDLRRRKKAIRCPSTAHKRTASKQWPCATTTQPRCYGMQSPRHTDSTSNHAHHLTTQGQTPQHRDDATTSSGACCAPHPQCRTEARDAESAHLRHDQHRDDDGMPQCHSDDAQPPCHDVQGPPRPRHRAYRRTVLKPTAALCVILIFYVLIGLDT